MGEELVGKTIAESTVNGYGITLVFTDGSEFYYDASDGGYSSYEFHDAE